MERLLSSVLVLGIALLVWRLPRSLLRVNSARQRRLQLPASRTVSETSFQASWVVTPDLCDGSGRVFGGELLKLIDVMAGVASRQHCGMRTVTISVDRVIFLSEVRLGDILHLSVSVNRAWTSSLETGVRCTKEDGHTGKKSYACHAYLTFVAIPPKPERWLPLLPKPRPIKVRIPEIEATSMLEKKRFLLAGRRRGHRVQRHPATSALLSQFRDYIFSLPLSKSDPVDEAAQEKQILKLQRDLIVEAFVTNSPDVHVSDDGEHLVASVEGFMEPIKIPMSEVKQAAKATGHGAFRPLGMERPPSDLPSPADGMYEQRVGLADTLAVSMWIVRPQHTNSANNLFGGQLLLWLEQVSSMTSRILHVVNRNGRRDDIQGKYIAGRMVGLSSSPHLRVFKPNSVFIRAVALHAWESSVEIYAVATAEGINDPPRFVADAFLTLIAMDRSTGRPLRGKLKPLVIPEGPAKDLATGAEKRREERLEDKRVLQAMYGK